MEPGQSEAKRPRFNNPPSPWPPSAHQEARPVLPPPQPSQHHQPALSPYQSHNLYNRQHPEHPPHPGHHHPEERRHHEQDAYPPSLPPPPLQDHRPPHSPAHPAFPPYPRRESIVKRENGDDASLPQMRRPNSTGTAPDGMPPHSHPPPYPGAHMDDHRRPTSFDNGGSIPPSPIYRPPQPPYAPPTPIQHNQYDASPSGYGPPSSVPDMYPNIAITSAKRKAQRASQACDNCRQLKAKCDEQRPCKNCKDKSLQCVYRDLPTKQPDKVSADILELMSSLKSEIVNLGQRITSLEHSINTNSNHSSDTKVESIEGDQHPNDYGLSAQESKNATEDEQQSSPRRNSDDPDKKQMVQHAAKVIEEMDQDDIESNPGPPIMPGAPSLPTNHTTLAALLLKWPSIEGLVKPVLKREGIHHINEFPISQEQQRGVLRVWGRGEGYILSNAKHESKFGQVITDVTQVDDSPGDTAHSAPSPYSEREGWTDREAWGTVGGGPTSTVEIHKGGVLYADGTPDFDRATVKQYVQSFKDNVLNMHPILIPTQLDAMVTMFLDSLPQSTKSAYKSGAKFVQSVGSSATPLGPEPGSKRKRSPAVEEPNIHIHRTGVPVSRSIHSALVLSVLALGKICLHKTRIPEPVSDSDGAVYHNSPHVRNGGPVSSPSQGSPPGPLPIQASGLPSPKDYNDRNMASRRASLQGSNATLRGQNYKRNIDVIPGLEYFALAGDILGSQISGYTLKHVYVELFMGLYHGQLGRVIESWSYIASAGRTLQVVLRPSLSRLNDLRANGRFPYSTRDNQLAFAFWTCLQLESDILAELQLPHSGILMYEEAIPFPNLSTQMNNGYSQDILTSYQAQLWVRKQLNQVHHQLYSLDLPDGGPAMQAKTEDLKRVLAKSEWVPKEFMFEDSDMPANDFLAARLRAKYWGSQVILYRPYIRICLHTPRGDGSSSVHKIDDKQGFHVPPGMNAQALNYARLGISALIQSTKAFHGLEKGHRILVTNVFTTAHAQWGNLLVLSACYVDEVLRQFIDRHELQELFLRTMDFFRIIAQSTSPLKIDLNILEWLYEQLRFPPTDHESGTSSSVSSMNSSAHAATGPHYPAIQNMLPPPYNSS
ncbi:hypothetical protein PFICI_07122 [Pestalotiopsis fici W106-1]|uniref:Zn(2)-C6 fungal-type domain-containing protein n=1 Tax=Pestalotiopsis fici (strain W106-1 / CGMCC3.15140) TaxID=1229662 RepID=W3X7T7_PESFW|nr:uncharacterized protein PFICI_07122 [Pestalotiopsis fici W106-1]ETS82120.1 hypothetical protein PFICI_07122 [Pestalotiopsis fici W106-1]